MRATGRRRTGCAVAASALAHLAVLAVVFTHTPALRLPPYVEAPSPDVIRVELVPRLPAPARPHPPRIHRALRPAPGAPAPRPVPLAAAAPAAAPQATAQGPSTFAPATSDLRAALRHGLAGCVNLASTGIGRAESDACNERLGRGAASAPFLPAPIPGRIRAYYDQVALAKAPDPLPVRQIIIDKTGARPSDLFAGYPTSGHGPGVGCKVTFGVGKKPPPLPHALRLGPCYIEPPKGLLDPEVDITPP